MTDLQFIADPALGKLCRWLRTLGFDCAYIDSKIDGSPDILHTGRILLTRHVDICQRCAVFIGEDDVKKQIRVMSRLFPIKEGCNPLSRCIRCNLPLIDAPKQEIKDVVPEHVFISHERFTRCPSCGRIYWSGTHVDRMDRTIRELLG